MDHFRREGDGQWLLTIATHDPRIELPALRGRIALVDLHDGVTLEEGR